MFPELLVTESQLNDSVQGIFSYLVTIYLLWFGLN